MSQTIALTADTKTPESYETHASQETEVPTLGHGHSHSPWWWNLIWTTDHKGIAKQYLYSSLFFLFFGGGLAMLIRWQLGFPGQPLPFIGQFLPGPYFTDGIMTTGFYNMLFTMHATIMIFLVVMPTLIGTFGNYLIPLKIGAGDMAFPRINELSFYLWFASGVVMCWSFIVPGGAANSGWTSYAPLSAVETYNLTKQGQSLWCLGIFLNGLASIAGAVNYITTIMCMRAPGLTMFKLPLSIWALLITSVLLILAVPVLSAAGALLWFDLNAGTSFFIASKGGDPILWQHLFWFFGHPEVYILILPAMGFVSEIMPVFCRKPIFGYRAMVYAMVVIAVLGFVVWGHHMFVSGMSLLASALFSLATMVIGVPTAIKTFNWLGTMWGASIRYKSPMLFSLGFIFSFVVGGFSGIAMASTPVNLFVHHTYYIVAHFHYVLFGGSIFGLYAAIYMWFPKMYGRMMNETWAVVHFVATFITFNLTFFPMHSLGLAGMMRRIADPTVYEHLRSLQPINQFVTYSAFLMGAAQIIFIVNFIYSARKGKIAGKNPWKATTLEWTVDSPPGHGNFAVTPRVYNGPYEYSVPGMDRDYLRQDEPAPAGALIDDGHGHGKPPGKPKAKAFSLVFGK
jgi:cytochrome c oxidase subunit I